jgi:hypothetical protein
MAFVMTSDALMALVVSGLLIAWSVDLIAQKPSGSDDVLAGYGYDFLAVAEKTGSLDSISVGCRRVNGTLPCTIPFRRLLNMTPQSLCIDAEMYFQDGSLYYHADNYNDTYFGERTGCLKRYASSEERPTTFVTISRINYYNGVIRPVKVELWYRGWKG